MKKWKQCSKNTVLEKLFMQMIWTAMAVRQLDSVGERASATQIEILQVLHVAQQRYH